MTDIQKAIKFAESEIKSLELAPKINGCEMTEWWKEQIEVWETAISALEKQIPKKPRVLKVHDISGYKYGDCFCGEHIMDDEKYCSNCGQKLLWESDAE